jgi:hypothetical protein
MDEYNEREQWKINAVLNMLKREYSGNLTDLGLDNNGSYFGFDALSGLGNSLRKQISDTRRKVQDNFDESSAQIMKESSPFDRGLVQNMLENKRSQVFGSTPEEYAEQQVKSYVNRIAKSQEWWKYSDTLKNSILKHIKDVQLNRDNQTVRSE